MLARKRAAPTDLGDAPIYLEAFSVAATRLSELGVSTRRKEASTSWPERQDSDGRR